MTTTSRASVEFEEALLIPSVTTWTRLEPQPRDATLARSLQAQVRDPLWFLARQWQVGEFAGDDAGSPVQATLGISSRPLTGYRAGPPGQVVAALDNATALETQVERVPVHFKLRGSVQLGLLFVDLVDDAALPAGTTAAFLSAFPIASSDPTPNLAGTDALQLRAVATGRAIDGEALFRSIQADRASQVADPPLPPEASNPAVAASSTGTTVRGKSPSLFRRSAASRWLGASITPATSPPSPRYAL